MDFHIPNKVKTMWDEWNLRAAVLVSLFFQILLIFISPFRKRTGNRIINLLIWGAYLLADWVAAFSVGLISSGQGNDCDKFPVNEDLAAFWAPFLLLHLGGPDTITAFSLEDNELWLRHLLGLLIQLVAVTYVFSQSVPNQFWISTVLMFFAGTIKYAERTRALYLACLGNFKNSMLPKPDAGPNYAQLMEEYASNETAQVQVKIVIRKEREKGSTASDEYNIRTMKNDIEVVEQGFKFFNVFKGLIVDLMFSFQDLRQSRKFFLERKCEDAFRVMEVELNFMYDALYTKMAVVQCKIGYLFRFLGSILIIVSFERFASHHKRGIHPFDIAVTYTLLIGAVCLDLVALVKLIFSDWTIVLLNSSKAKEIVNAIREGLPFDKRQWSYFVSQHSLIDYCLKKRFKWFDKTVEVFGLKDFLDEMQYKRTDPVMDELKMFIFEEIRNKALKAADSKIAKELSSARGNWVLLECSCHDPPIVRCVSEEVAYDESLLLWHIATELCYFTIPESSDQKIDEKTDRTGQNREFCKLLSEYMLYLLVMRPTMMSAVAGLGQIRFGDTCEEAKRFFRRGQSNLMPTSIFEKLKKLKPTSICEKFKKFFPKSGHIERQNPGTTTRQSKSTEKQNLACNELLKVNMVVKPADVKGDRSKSVLFDACLLAKELNKLPPSRKWEIMSKVWVELLTYAATHCRANAHAQQLSKGGELITFVWLLMAHFGLGEQFQVEAGHARAKLIGGN